MTDEELEAVLDGAHRPSYPGKLGDMCDSVSSLVAEVRRLREALEQVIVDILDQNPRNGTLEGFARAMKSTRAMVEEALK